MVEGSRHSRESGKRAMLDVGGSKLAYESTGNGTPLLFIHAAIADSRMWNREMEVFSAGHQVVRFDLRGYGNSTPATGSFSCVRDIRALVSHLQLSRPFIVGCSMGGAFAVEYALAHPDEVSGLLLAAPGLGGTPYEAFSKDEMPAFEYDDKKSAEIAEAWSNGKSSEAMELLRQLWCSALTGSSRELFMEMVKTNAEEVFNDRSFRQLESRPPAYKRLPSIRVPTTVLVGDRDNPSSVPFANLVARGIAGARLVTVQGADHLINMSRPNDFETELRHALDRAGQPIDK